MAIFNPPETTRGFFRGRSVARFNQQIESIQWDEVVFANGAERERVSLPEPSIGDERLQRLNDAARNGRDFAAFVEGLRAGR
jgi:proteasome accessory factor A